MKTSPKLDSHFCFLQIKLSRVQNVINNEIMSRDFYEVMADQAEGLINYHLIEIESE